MKIIFENCIRLFFNLIKFQTEYCYIIFFYVQVVHKGRDNTRFSPVLEKSYAPGARGYQKQGLGTHIVSLRSPTGNLKCTQQRT